MSYASYLENVRVGATGPDTNTCFTAAIEMTMVPTICPRTHMAYEGYTSLEKSIPKRHRPNLMSKVFDMIAIDAGLDSHKDIGFENAESSNQLKLLLRKLFKKNAVIVADIDLPQDGSDLVCYDPEDNAHAIGIVPLSICQESFKVVGTWLPDGIEETEVYTPEDLFDWIQHYRDKPLKKWPFQCANITYLPVERDSLN